jgi:sensor c-di-GMP phosphodiesterase-like protein
MTTRPRRPSAKTTNRQLQLKNEIYAILHKEAHDWFSFLQTREDNLQNRLNAMEKAGVPSGALEEIKSLVSRIEYRQRQQQKAMEGLLSFLNITKDFFSEPPVQTENK